MGVPIFFTPEAQQVIARALSKLRHERNVEFSPADVREQIQESTILRCALD